ncbi:MAG: porin, partial [Thiothrix litoralis]
ADIRIAKVQASSPKYGTVWVGQDWLPYYNDIAYPVDYFSSYYSGFATFTTFRKDQTIAYSSPDMNGFTVNAAHSRGNGNADASGNKDDRNQATASYTRGDTKVALGVDDIGGADNRKIIGASLAQKLGDFYVGAKYEQHQSDVSDPTVYGHDGSSASNLFVQHSKGKHTLKGHIAKVDNYGDDIFHVGYDYQLNKKTKLFAEYYSEETGGAITTERGGYRDTYWTGGGKAIAAGLRYDFDTKLPK